MTFDFSALLERQRERLAGVDPAAPERDRVVGFDVRRGEVTIPASLLVEGAEHELARYIAKSLPDDCTTVTRQKVSDGSIVLRWRKVRVVELS